MISVMTGIACVIVSCGPPAACERAAVLLGILELALLSAQSGELVELV
jgi:hypothetical protein